MIQLKTFTRKNSTYPITKWWCPICKKSDTFYSISPRVCPNCLFDNIPNLRRLKENGGYRLHFHLSYKK